MCVDSLLLKFKSNEKQFSRLFVSVLASHCFLSPINGHGRWQGGRTPPPPDFHAWYWYRCCCFSAFFFPLPPLEIFMPTPLSTTVVAPYGGGWALPACKNRNDQQPPWCTCYSGYLLICIISRWL